MTAHDAVRCCAVVTPSPCPHISDSGVDNREQCRPFWGGGPPFHLWELQLIQGVGGACINGGSRTCPGQERHRPQATGPTDTTETTRREYTKLAPHILARCLARAATMTRPHAIITLAFNPAAMPYNIVEQASAAEQVPHVDEYGLLLWIPSRSC